MSDEKDKWEGRQPEARKIIDQVRTELQGRAMSPEQAEKAQRRIAEAGQEHVLEAAGFAEDIIKWLSAQWVERGFTREQCVFSITLAAINLRQTFPADKGGTEAFDRINKEAAMYYQQNAGK